MIFEGKFDEEFMGLQGLTIRRNVRRTTGIIFNIHNLISTYSLSLEVCLRSILSKINLYERSQSGKTQYNNNKSWCRLKQRREGQT